MEEACGEIRIHQLPRANYPLLLLQGKRPRVLLSSLFYSPLSIVQLERVRAPYNLKNHGTILYCAIDISTYIKTGGWKSKEEDSRAATTFLTSINHLGK